MMIREGNSIEELIKTLKEEDSLTNQDVLVKTGQKITLDCCRTRSGFTKWTLSCHGSQLASQKPFKTGRNYKSFEKALADLDEEADLFETPDCMVLCYVSGNMQKDWKGNVVSSWICINPWTPYHVKNGVPVFETVELRLTESEFQVMTETGLALWCETTDILYPITETAYPSMGRILDCTAAFNRVDQHLLGTALLLAEKLTYRKKLTVICRERTSRVRSVVGIAGKRYTNLPQSVFFEKSLFCTATQLGVFHVQSWSVSDQFTELTICYPRPYEDYDLIVQLKASDANRMPYTLIASVDFGKIQMPLVIRKLEHTAKGLEEKIPTLFDGIQDEFLAFEEAYEAMEHSDIEFCNHLLKDVYAPLGSRRRSSMTLIPNGIYPAADLFREVLQSVENAGLSEKQDGEMKQALYEFFWQIEESMEEAKQKAGGQ